jgi:gamma-glutamylcyclotransferase (GGCT)/AIG2-like uncharacterized protein YtfP
MYSDMSPLFVYGTLRHPMIISSVLGRVPDGVEAVLNGYGRYGIVEEDFPGIAPEPNGRVDGKVYAGITDEEWVMLDRYESELYVRQLVDIARRDGITEKAFAYVIPDRHRHYLSTESWDLKHYHPTHPPAAE